MPDASITDALGDAFEQGQAAMESNGSWLVATHQAAGLDFGIAPLPKGPAGQATSINPTGAVVYKGTKNPDAAWEFVKYLASPAAQTKLMELKASLPANKEVLTGPFATSFDGAKVLADAIAYAHIKPSFKGYNEWTTALQTELDANVFNDAEQDRQAGDHRRPAGARRDPRRPVRSTADRPDGRDDRQSAAPPPRRGGGPLGRRGPLGAGCSSPRPCSGSPCCRPGRSSPRSRSA